MTKARAGEEYRLKKHIFKLTQATYKETQTPQMLKALAIRIEECKKQLEGLRRAR
jgi:hypothetical protein